MTYEKACHNCHLSRPSASLKPLHGTRITVVRRGAGADPAGVSYQIKLLEERLGAQLFMRKGRGMALTPLGKRIAPRVTEAFALLGEAFAAAQAENESVLTITCSRTFATNWLAVKIGRST